MDGYLGKCLTKDDNKIMTNTTTIKTKYLLAMCGLYLKRYTSYKYKQSIFFQNMECFYIFLLYVEYKTLHIKMCVCMIHNNHHQ